MSEENQNQNEGLQNLLKKYDSDWAALAGELYSQTGKLREKNRALEQEKQTLEQDKTDLLAKLPKDGSRVLSKTESDRYDALMKLEAGGKAGDAEAIANALKTGSEAQQRAHRADTRENLRALGYQPTERLLREFDSVTLTVAEGDDKKPVAKVKAGDEETGFADWATAQGLADDLERYRAAPERPPVYSGRGNAGGKAADAVDAYVAAQKAAQGGKSGT